MSCHEESYVRQILINNKDKFEMELRIVYDDVTGDIKRNPFTRRPCVHMRIYHKKKDYVVFAQYGEDYAVWMAAKSALFSLGVKEIF